MKPQPLIAVNDVESSSRWYQAVLGLSSGHGGKDYEQLLFRGRMVLQLHRWDAHAHPHIGRPELNPHGNGVLLWFQTAHFDRALQRITRHGATVLEGPEVNANAHHREIWLQDPDGYVVALAGAYGDLG
ncbi:MAG: VOC family protein [Gammaproteobacteria bacterium]|nr:VOC family protein [Gammaproteobacteria bacterium]